jgi:hypothetical protein
MDQKMIAPARRRAADIGWRIAKVRGRGIHLINEKSRLVGEDMTAEEVIELCEYIEHLCVLHQSD